MYISSSQMPSHSRVWIYQSNRKLSAGEIESVSEKTKQFLESWTAHDKMLKASFEIRYDLFLILIIDEKVAGASGCSIDKSVHFVQSLEMEFNFSLLNRMLFAVKKGNSVEVLSKNDFEKQLATGELNDNTVVFNNLVQTKEELEAKWEVPMRESWHAKVKN
jgi:hypothetical protein